MGAARNLWCCFLILALTTAPITVTGRRILHESSSSDAQFCHLKVTQLRLPWEQLTDQLRSRATYFEAIADETFAGQSVAVSNFAATSVGLGGGYLSAVASFTVNVNLGTPGVSLPLIIDTGSHVNFVQGPECTNCAVGSQSCANDPYSGPSNCPYNGANYNPAQSSTAVSQPSCAACADPDNTGNVGCLGRSFSPPNTCQFGIRFGDGHAAGQYIQDTLSIGSVTAQKLFFGTTIYEHNFDGVAGLLGFGPTAASLPFQLKAAGAVSSSTFALCLASGRDTGGTLFLDGVPSQPSNQPYALSYTPILQTPFVYYIIPQPTDFLVGGVSVSGASGEFAAEAFPSTYWIVDSGERRLLVQNAAIFGLANGFKMEGIGVQSL
jgi:hypothetical protein